MHGVAGTPLKWCDGKEHGEMWPRSSKDKKNDAFKNYPPLVEEFSALKTLVASDDLDIASPKSLIVPEVKTAGGDPSPVKAFGLTGNGAYVVWLFDDDFDETWDDPELWGLSDRTYAVADEGSKSTLRLVLPNMPAKTYQVRRFNTWDGTISTDPSVKLEAAGDLKIPVGSFSLDDDHGAATWDGADVLLLIE